MSKRKKAAVVAPPPRPEVGKSSEQSALSPGRGPELLRKLVLVLATALIVARPVVLGEDPGLTESLSGPSGMALTLGWLAAALGWAGWRLWSGQGSWYVGPTEVALLAVTALVFLSGAAAAHYKHPAWLIGWEWLGLCLALLLVRQMAVGPAEFRGLLAAVLATGVSLAAYGIFQSLWELPHLQKLLASNSAQLAEALAQTGQALTPEMAERIQQNNAFATFAHPNSFAGYLALLLPAAVGYAAAGWRFEPRSWQTWGLTGCAVVTGAALWLTHSRGAILAALLVGAAAAAFAWRDALQRHKGRALAAAAAVAVLVALATQLGPVQAGLNKACDSLALRFGYWQAAWAMIQDHPWFGVGPGNFDRWYLRYMLPTAHETLRDPHNFLLEIWATSGLFAALCLVAALVAFYRQVVDSLRSATAGWWEGGVDAEPAAGSKQDVAPRPLIPVAYVGGMAGLLLSFAFRASGLSQNDLVIETLVTIARSLVWFGAFALFDRLHWSGRSRALALAAGVTALLLNLLVSGGISYPQAAQPLWVMAALTLNAVRPAPFLLSSRGWAGLLLPVAGLGALSLVYLLTYVSPEVTAASWAHDAETAENYFRKHPAVSGRQPEKGEKVEPMRNPPQFFARAVIDPLKKAVEESPNDAALRLRLAQAYQRLWDMLALDRSQEKYFVSALEQIKQAERLDPDNVHNYLAEARLYEDVALRHRLEVVRGLLFTQPPLPFPLGQTALLPLRVGFLANPRYIGSLRDLGRAVALTSLPLPYPEAQTALLPMQAALLNHPRYVGSPRRARFWYGAAAGALQRAIPCDPNNPALRYRRAEDLFSAGLDGEGRRAAEEALQLDRGGPHPRNSLTDPQREQIRRWLGPAGSP
ncbi:MAG TPA: O-antigen ligase family protein [Gemmataceae bacterium]|nr:O-antigen ligase family protein [Gemmataceae bacterium]